MATSALCNYRRPRSGFVHDNYQTAVVNGLVFTWSVITVARVWFCVVIIPLRRCRVIQPPFSSRQMVNLSAESSIAS